MRPHAFRPFLVCSIVLFVGLAGGATLAWIAKRTLVSDLRALGAVETERRTAEERIVRLAQEGRELGEHLAIWNRLAELRILGEERRLEWLDGLARIRAARGLQDLRYQIEPQKPRKTGPDPARLEVRASMMKVELALLHEGDLLRFLDDVRGLGNAHAAIRRCSIHRSPGLRARCEIELITIGEAKAKT
jgi:hypothetical protein